MIHGVTIERDFTAGFASAGEDVALDADDRGDLKVLVGSLKFVGGIENRGDAGFVTVATGTVATVMPARCCGGGDFLDPPIQRRLVVLNQEGLPTEYEVLPGNIGDCTPRSWVRLRLGWAQALRMPTCCVSLAR